MIWFRRNLRHGQSVACFFGDDPMPLLGVVHSVNHATVEVVCQDEEGARELRILPIEQVFAAEPKEVA